MFRIGFKFPCNGVNRVKKRGYSKLYLTTRYYEIRTPIKTELREQLRKDVNLISRFPSHNYSTSSPKSGKTGSSKIVVTLGAVTIGAVGLLIFAKNNPEFRATLEGWIPGTNKTIQIIFQEESNYIGLLNDFLSNLKEQILNTFGSTPQEAASHTTQKTKDHKKQEDYTPPKPVFESLVDKKEPPINEPYSEIRLSNEKGETIEILAEKPAAAAKNTPQELMPKNLVELETYCGQTAAKAIAAYRNAISAIEDYNQIIIKIVESSDSLIATNTRHRLKEAMQKRKETLQHAEEHGTSVLDSLRYMYNLVDEPKFEVATHLKAAARRNVQQILNDVDDAKKKFEEELEKGNITERFWQQVQTAREHFNEELQILFPNINLQEKKFSVTEGDFDLFVLHMYNKVRNLQEELAKLQIINISKMKSVLKATGEDVTQEKLNTLVCLEVDKEKQILNDEFSKKLLEEEKKFDDKLRQQLKLLSQVHADHLQESLKIKDQENERKLKLLQNELTEASSIQFKTQLASVIGRLRGLETVVKARIEDEKGASDAQLLWSACMALARAIKATPSEAFSNSLIRPLEPEIQAVSKAAPKEDQLVRAAINGIPQEASKRGVYSEDALRKRFLEVEKRAKKLALVPEEGAALPIHFLSYLQSALIINTSIPTSELEDGPIDIESLNTFDILQRARYWMDRGDFKMTLRYMNLLKGASKSVSKEWMNEARILLETKQAIDTLLAYASATGLVFLGSSSSSKPMTVQK